MCPLQAQSVDADCARVAAAARDATGREIARIDAAEQEVARKIERSKSCTDAVIRELNRMIPSFGTGVVDSIASSLLANFAKGACQMMGGGAAPGVVVMSPPIVVDTPSSLPVPGGKEVPAAVFGAGTAGSTSIWDRLGGVN